MKLIKKQISGITNFYIDNLSIALDTAKRYSINLWSEGTQKQGAFSKTLYFDDTLEEWRMRDHDCENKNKSLDFSVVIEENTLKSLETLKAYGIDNGGIAIFSEVYFELNEIANKPVIPHKAIEIIDGKYDEDKIIKGYLAYFTQGLNNGPFFSDGMHIYQLAKTDFRFEGEITRVYIFNNDLIFERFNKTTLSYKPIIKSYTYSNTDTHSFNIDEEKFWTLTIPFTSFGGNTNVLNVRIGTVDTSNGGYLRNSFVSTWEKTNDNLSVKVYMKNTLGIPLNVVNVSLIIETI